MRCHAPDRRHRRRSGSVAAAAAAAATLLLAATFADPTTAGATSAPGARLERGKMLVASADLPDPNFRRTVILLLEYDATGALGVIVDRPTEIALGTVLPEIAELKGRPETVFLGGPVARDRMVLLVRTSKPPDPGSKVLDGLFLTTSFDVLRELARGPRDPVPFRAFVGYAGWAPGQLDAEVARGDWDVVPGDTAKILAREPAQLWEQLHARDRGEWVRGAPPAAAQGVCRASTPAFTS